jgi:lysophospholipase L1-like esterase
MEKNISADVLKIFGIVLLLLIINSYAPAGLNIFGFEIKQIDFLGDVRTDEFIESQYEDEEYFEEDDEYYDESDSGAENDSVLLEGEPQYNLASLFTLNFISDFVTTELDKLEDYSKVVASSSGNNLSGNITQLNKFFSALKNTKNKKVRVAHFGDSTLEGDLITSDLRELFQLRYGGTGVGIVPITSQDTKFRQTTDLSFSEDWKVATVFSRNKNHLPLGINGHVFVNSANSWVEMKTNNRYKTVRKFDVAKLFYADAKSNAEVKYSFNGGKVVTKSLTSGNGLHILEVKKSGAKSIKMEFPQSNSAYYYGISLESGNGVYIDNFALRGNSGVDLKKITTEYLEKFNTEMDYKLVILEFGLNILSGRKTNFSRYEKSMVKIIKRMKTAMPNASFLLVGVHDKCVKKGSKFVTDPAVLKLVEAQKSIAHKADIAFWNLFEAMGGKNSMIKWVSANPPRAFKDYTHFNDVGSKKEAKMLFDELMKKNK